MALTQLIYCSQPFGFDEAMLNGILITARACNTRDDITGALICRADIYLQLLEGPEAAVEAAFTRIARDDRHLDVSCLMSTTIQTRLFPRWAMRDDPARSWLWTEKEIADGAATRATPQDLRAIFERVAGQS